MSDLTPSPGQRAARFLRRQSPWLLALAVLIAWPYLGALLATFTAAQAPAADQAAAAAQAGAQWLGLSLPASKLLLAALAFAVGLGLAWLTLSFVVPVLASWAKGKYVADGDNNALDFKHTFLHLPRQWQMLTFCVIWLGLLLYFALCWLAASLVQ